jgi:Icc-related predicted phosphoesterase
MPACLFVSDLHGRRGRYDALWRLIAAERPTGVFLGGDLLPHAMDTSWRRGPDETEFVVDVLIPGFAALRRDLGDRYPRVFLILGNDDPRAIEPELLTAAEAGLWDYVHGRRAGFGRYGVYGYACIPPSPFLLKDWERYDVSRFVDPGCVSPEEGLRTAGPDARAIRHTTIAAELEAMVGDDDLADAILLCHCPPHGCRLDRADLDGKMVDHAPVDVHVGSIAISRFIAARQPLLSLHGHVHESRRLTGAWRERFGRTVACNAAHDGPELAVIRFDPDAPDAMRHELVQAGDSGSS